MPKYIKHYIQQKGIQNFNEKKNRKVLILNFLKVKKKKKNSKIKMNITFARTKSRCMVSGRAKGYYSQFKLGRHAIKKIFTMGKIPGIILSSW